MGVPRRGTGDFFDVLVPEYLEPPEMWYCPGGALFPDSGVWTVTLHQMVNTIWDFVGVTQHDSHLTEIVYVNLTGMLGYSDIARKLSDPSDWVVVNDNTGFDIDRYYKTAHPGRAAYWGVGSTVKGRNGPGAPRGINTGTANGSVKWTQQQDAMRGYPACGGGPTSFPLCHQLEPPRPGRSAMLP